MDSDCENNEQKDQPFHTDFFGRIDEQEWFFSNLCLDPNDPKRKTVVNISGISGIGKSYLLDELEACSERLGFVTTRISKDITSPLDAIYRIACQLSGKGFNFSKLIDRYDQFLRRRGELAKLSELEVEEFVGTTLGKVADEVIKGKVPSGTDPSNTALTPIGSSVGRFFGTVRKNQQVRANRDEDLNPLRTFSALFLKHLEEELADQAWICFIDGFDQTRDILESWLALLFGGEYGMTSARHLVIIASQTPLNIVIWANLLSMTKPMDLQVFSNQEVKEFLRTKGIIESKLVQAIIEQTRGLPLDLSHVASQQPQSVKDLNKLSEDQYDHYFSGFSDPKQKKIATICALARQLDQDVLAALIGVDKNPAEMFEWLRTKTAFLKKLSDGRGWEYHDLIRAAAINHVWTTSRKTWRELHQLLADYYQKQREDLGIQHEDGLKNYEYQALTLNFLYHTYCAQPIQCQAVVINAVVEALSIEGDLDLHSALVLQQAEEDNHTPDSERWGNLIVDGLRAIYERKDVQKCKDMLDRILSYQGLAPHLRSLPYHWRGISHLLMGKVELSIEDFTNAINLEPSNAEYYFSRVASYLELGQHQLAITDATRAIELEQSNARYYHARGVSHHVAGHYKEAIADFTRAIYLEPGNAKYYNSRGLTYHATKQFDEAILDFSRAIEIEPDNSRYHSSLGNSYSWASRYQEAIASFTRAIKLEPENANYRFLRWATYFVSGLFKEAITDCTRAIELEPSEVSYYFYRGVNNHAIGQYKEAIADFTHAIDLEPGMANYYDSRAASYHSIGRYKEAIADCTRAIDLEPANAEYYYSRGFSYHAISQYEEAIADCTRALELDPCNAKYYDSRGACYYETNRHKEAITDCTSAIKIDPNNARYYYSLGACYHEVGGYKEAVANYTRAIELDPGNAKNYDSRGAAFLDAGQYKEAIMDCTSAIELEPDNPLWYGHRAILLDLIGMSDLAAADHDYAENLRKPGK